MSVAARALFAGLLICQGCTDASNPVERDGAVPKPDGGDDAGTDDPDASVRREACEQLQDLTEVRPGADGVRTVTVELPSEGSHSGSCGGRSGEVAFRLTSTSTEAWRLSTTSTGGFDSVLYVRNACTAEGSEVACNDDYRAAERGQASLAIELSAASSVFVFVDGFRADRGGSVSVHAKPIALLPLGETCHPGSIDELCTGGRICAPDRWVLDLQEYRHTCAAATAPQILDGSAFWSAGSSILGLVVSGIDPDIGHPGPDDLSLAEGGFGLFIEAVDANGNVLPSRIVGPDDLMEATIGDGQFRLVGAIELEPGASFQSIRVRVRDGTGLFSDFWTTASWSPRAALALGSSCDPHSVTAECAIGLSCDQDQYHCEPTVRPWSCDEAMDLNQPDPLTAGLWTVPFSVERSSLGSCYESFRFVTPESGRWTFFTSRGSSPLTVGLSSVYTDCESDALATSVLPWTEDIHPQTGVSTVLNSGESVFVVIRAECGFSGGNGLMHARRTVETPIGGQCRSDVLVQFEPCPLGARCVWPTPRTDILQVCQVATAPRVSSAEVFWSELDGFLSLIVEGFDPEDDVSELTVMSKCEGAPTLERTDLVRSAGAFRATYVRDCALGSDDPAPLIFASDETHLSSTSVTPRATHHNEKRGLDEPCSPLHDGSYCASGLYCQSQSGVNTCRELQPGCAPGHVVEDLALHGSVGAGWALPGNLAGAPDLHRAPCSTGQGEREFKFTAAQSGSYRFGLDAPSMAGAVLYARRACEPIADIAAELEVECRSGQGRVTLDPMDLTRGEVVYLFVESSVPGETWSFQVTAER